MRGIGDILSDPVALPKVGIIIVHPGVAMPTAPVFAALGLRHGERCPARPASAAMPDERDALLRWLAAERNDLEAPAISIAPGIADVLGMIGTLQGCRLARMSGSGSACFGLFDDEGAAATGAGRLANARTRWWVRASSIGG
jgi:4-diphosphocytidyl-2-C-methyl-D-erythritol kinase